MKKPKCEDCFAYVQTSTNSDRGFCCRHSKQPEHGWPTVHKYEFCCEFVDDVLNSLFDIAEMKYKD